MKKKTKLIFIVISIMAVVLTIIAILLFGEDDSGVKGKSYGAAGGFFFAPEGVVVDDYRIQFVDPVSSQTYLMCRIPNCNHEEGNEECEARAYTNFSLIYDEKLYCFKTSALNSEIWVRELAGNGESKFLTIPYRHTKRESIVVDGKLYCSVNEPLDDYGMERSNAFFVEINLETGEYRRLTEEEPYEDYKIKKIELYNGYLYYTCEVIMPEYYDKLDAAIGSASIELYDEAEKYKHILLHKVDLDTLEKTNCYNDEERYLLHGVCGEHLILWDSFTGEILAVNKYGEEKIIGKVEMQNRLSFYPVMGKYVVYEEDEKTLFVSVESGEKYEREIKSPGSIILYNETLDAIFTVISDYKGIYRIISVEDFIAGNYEDYKSFN
ncbi:MAG: hypothetical protein E7261_10075 [Lachnospiraceae bacterium]|nr:hypothetical protein [Lachnospiraceae bacterium]